MCMMFVFLFTMITISSYSFHLECLLVLIWFYRVVFFFFKQKTAYDMRISHWSSDVCSSDLGFPLPPHVPHGLRHVPNGRGRRRAAVGQRELGNRPMSFFAIRGRITAAVLAGALAPVALSTPTPAAEMDDQIYTFFQLDQNEYRLSDAGEHAYAWDAQGWIGTDYDQLFLKSEGEQPLEGQIGRSA